MNIKRIIAREGLIILPFVVTLIILMRNSSRILYPFYHTLFLIIVLGYLSTRFIIWAVGEKMNFSRFGLSLNIIGSLLIAIRTLGIPWVRNNFPGFVLTYIPPQACDWGWILIIFGFIFQFIGAKKEKRD